MIDLEQRIEEYSTSLCCSRPELIDYKIGNINLNNYLNAYYILYLHYPNHTYEKAFNDLYTHKVHLLTYHIFKYDIYE